MFLFHAKASLFASMALLNVCGALTYAIERSLVAYFIGHSMRGKAEGFMSVSYYLGAAIGSLIGGILYSTHPPLLLFSASTLLALGSGLSLIYLRKLPRL
jgi:predicted MFS family arabinose efflux permease